MVANSNIVLVTGAMGLVGKNIASGLHNYGFEVIATDKIEASDLPYTYIQADLINDDLGDLFDHVNFDHVIHCAAALPAAGIEMEECYQLNQQIDNKVLELIKKRVSVKLIYLSGTSLYDNDATLKTENSDVKGINPYFKSKLDSEIRFASELDSFTSLRVTAPYHPTQKANTVLKIFIEKALKGESITYNSEGSRCQDFTHVDDVTSAVIQCILIEDCSGIFNISGGGPISMKNLANLICKIVPDCKSEITSSGKKDIQEGHMANFSIDKAKEVLKWVPKISLEQGIKMWIEQTTI